ncbi:hypothetical protein [Streptomyces sp. NPDC059171]|uniref:hypothetical protein n=1 Tax=Streptomyces sp. NPDC059171 TaxID=3346755 RepID=UPI0036796064
MSRTHWWSLTALLAVVLGLLCGPGASAAGPGTSAPVTQVARGPAQAQDAGARGRAATGAEAPGRAEAEGTAPDRTRHRGHPRVVTGAAAAGPAVTGAVSEAAVAGSAVSEAATRAAPEAATWAMTGAAVAGPAVTGAVSEAAVSEAVTRAVTRAVTGAAVAGSAAPEAVTGPVVAEAAGERAPVPGCGKLRDHDGEPAVPSRARSSHDHVPGLASWGLPAATGAPSAEPTPGIRARAPVPYTPTPVELSVLRV